MGRRPVRRAAGRDAIRAFLEHAGRLVSFSTHYLLNSEIEMDGDTARGTWLLWQQMVLRETGQAYRQMASTPTPMRVQPANENSRRLR